MGERKMAGPAPVGAVLLVSGMLVAAGCSTLEPDREPRAVQACAEAPSLVVKPVRPAAGGELRVGGDGYAFGCGDRPPATPPKGVLPDRNIALRFWQGEKGWMLGVADAREDFSLEKRVAVPEEAVSGNAVITAKSDFGTTADLVIVEEPDGGPAGTTSEGTSAPE